MKYVFLAIHVYLTLCVVHSLTAQRFACDGQSLIAINNGISTSISRPFYIPFSPAFLSPISNYQNASFDAMGFNSKDNFIYAIQENTNAVIRLRRDNSYVQVGTVNIVDTLKTYAGDCTPDGLYICHEQRLHQMLVFEVVDAFSLIQRIDLFWDPNSPNNGPFTTQIFDFAIDPNNPSVAYAYQGIGDDETLKPVATQGYMLKINLDFNDPNLGMVTPIALIDENRVAHLGSLLFTPYGGLIGYGTSEQGFNPKQRSFYNINPFSGDISNLVINNTGALLSDGCSCPYSFTFTCQVPTEGMYCNNDKKNILIQIVNNSFNPLENIILRDTLPEGMIIDQITGTFSGSIVAGTGIGSSMLEITDLLIPAKSTLEISLKIQTIDAKVGVNSNQAFLENLPEKFGGPMASDDASTFGLEGDPSKLIVVPRRLDDVTWEVTHPTDCLLANDGQIVVKSAQFLPDQNYEITIRNKVGWEETSSLVVIDQNNSFLLDSLIPGNYQLRQVRSLTDNCSLQVQDTSIIIEAPNDLFVLSVSSNSPICEGQDLILQSQVSPDGVVRWTGPNLFGYDDLNPIIESATVKYNGEYKIVAKYGYCEQTQFLDGVIKPFPMSMISGKSQYCERDNMVLKIDAIGDDLTHDWTGPDNLILAGATLDIGSMSEAKAGYYEAITSNNACGDTVGVEIIVLPTPSIDIEDQYFTDFCEDIVLSPTITGDENVSYTWSPQEGLSCIDCPSPTVQATIEPQYQVNVENSYACTDSATISIILDKSKIAYGPNVFSLSAQVENDRFTLYPACIIYQIERLDIFDRWGNQVFSSKTSTPDQSINHWDGYIDGQTANPGVYSWSAEVVLVDGSRENLYGTVTFL